MALRIDRKQEIVAEVNAAANAAFAAVAADYRGLTVAQMTGLRAAARDSGVQLRVVRNTLARRALAGTGHEQLGAAFVGPTMLALSEAAEDPGVAARLLRQYVAEYDALEVKALSVGGRLLEADALAEVAALPTLDEARARLMSVMTASVGKLARTLSQVPGKLVRTLAAVRDSKQDPEQAEADADA